MMINRRSLLTTALTLGAIKAFPGLSYAQARPLVFATFTGSWEEAHKAVLVPAFRKANADASIVLDPMLSVDQIAKVRLSLQSVRISSSPTRSKRAPITRT